VPFHSFLTPFAGDGGSSSGRGGDSDVGELAESAGAGRVGAGAGGLGFASASGGGGKHGALRSYESVVGPTFEHEARLALGSVFREVCPWVTDYSDILSRTLDRDGNAREGDLMCYLKGDSLQPCVSAPIHGVRVIEIAAPDVAVPPLSAIDLPVDVQFSPTDFSRRGPHKYFIGEAYSGEDSRRMESKVAQLESLCGFLRQRWDGQHPERPATDVTEIVGAVALVFSAGDSSRLGVLNEVADRVSRKAVGANLQRLIAARRLFVAVLEKGQSPNTYFQRAVAAQIKSASDQIAAVKGDVAAVKGDVAAVKGDVAAVKGDVAAVKGDVAAVKVGVEAILAAQRSAAAAAGSVGR
jgi:hypothetical protein